MTESARPCHSQGIGKRETQLLKLTADRPFADPSKAARRLLEHAHAFEPTRDGRIYIEKINGPFLFGDKGIPAEYTAGLKRAISLGWLELHESGTFVKLTQSGADMFA
jgi:hypothetical protein